MMKKGLCVLSLSAVMMADTTICYKKDHLDPSTIENTPLYGRECAGKLSVKDMKNDGYIVEDIKIQAGNNGLNYIYVFKQDMPSAPLITKQSKAKIKEKEDKDNLALSIEAGKKLYINSCSNCHGVKAQKEAYNTSRALASLSLGDIENSIRAYSLGEQDNGMGILMESYATLLNTKDIKNIYNYIQTIK